MRGAAALLSAPLLPAVVLGAVLGLSGCKVVSVAEDRAMRERMTPGGDAQVYVDRIWDSSARAYWSDHATPVADLAGPIDADLDAVGAQHGRRAGDGSPWSFVVEGEGRVTAVEPGRRGRLVLAVPGVARPVLLQVGPVVSGSALRDSLPSIRFDDFSNQLEYADVAQALNGRALKAVAPVAAGAAVGRTVRFSGVLMVAETGGPLVVTPYALQAGGAA